MTPAQATTYIRYRTKTDSTVFTDAEILLLLGIYIKDFAKRITEVNEDYFVLPATTGLVANQREYPLPSDILNNIKYVEAKLNGTDWVKLDEFDLNEYKRTTDETTIVANFSNDEGNAFFDISRNALWLYTGTIIEVAAGLKAWYTSLPAVPTDLTSTTDMSIDPSSTEHGFPVQFHELLCRRVVIDYKTAGDRNIPLTESEQNFEVDFQKALDAIHGMNQDRAIVGRIPNSSNTPTKTRWQEGYDL